MEYMDGGSCDGVLCFRRKQGLPEPLVATILYEVLKSLSYLHEKRQLHRDIKPGNILLNSRGEVKITDFGIASTLLEGGHRVLARYTVTGTPCYMAPEVMRAHTGYTEKADIWSLGITAIELATGVAPYADLKPLEVVIKLTNSPPPALPENGRFSPAFREFVRLCLNPHPAKRPTAAELIESRFIRQRGTPADLVDGLLRTLPSLPDRFKMMFSDEDLKVIAARQPPKDTHEWVFDLPPVEPPIEVKKVLQRVGRFTVTRSSSAETILKPLGPEAPSPLEGNDTQPSPQQQPQPPKSKVQELEEEVIVLRQKVVTLSARNEDLSQSISRLSAMIQTLKHGRP
jgi:serine/threonine-protein kinase OSR1/STK39